MKTSIKSMESYWRMQGGYLLQLAGETRNSCQSWAKIRPDISMFAFCPDEWTLNISNIFCSTKLFCVYQCVCCHLESWWGQHKSASLMDYTELPTVCRLEVLNFDIHHLNCDEYTMFGKSAYNLIVPSSCWKHRLHFRDYRWMVLFRKLSQFPIEGGRKQLV